MKTTGYTIGVPDLEPSDREGMFRLLRDSYLGVNREDFEHDLAAKEHVILLRSSEGEIVGFSTQTRLRFTLPDRTVVVVFSGDTIISEQHRGTFETAREICRYFRRTLEEHPDEDLYWLLICKGWRTYRVLRLFFRDYSPRAGASDPSGVSRRCRRVWNHQVSRALPALLRADHFPRRDAAHTARFVGSHRSPQERSRAAVL